VVYVSYQHSQAAIRNSVNTNLLVATENTGKAIDNWMDARKDDLRIISSIAENSEEEKFRKYLNSFQNEHEGVYQEFFIIDAGGNVIFSTLNNPSNALKEPFLKDALEGRLFISDVSLSSTTNLPEVIITNPIRKNDTITGIMGARVSIENLYMIIEGIDIGRSGEIFLVNSKGELIFHKDRLRILHENINNNFAVKEVIYEKNGVGDYINYNGENVLGSYYWLPLYRWGLIVEQNRDEAYAYMMTLEKETAVISIFAVFCVVIVG
jgi:methyl-accepting chemotaxis protein